jgi:DNA (cytosine-5)-methyltransferase 1
MTPRPSSKKLRAIDLYAGVGGWSLGLTMAGMEVVGSYEWWGQANVTNLKNNCHKATEIDIRTLDLADLPSGVEVVVGSPPCTQFSFANRGGSGDIADGLKDVAKFLEVVEYVRPRFWAMENVPRVAGILEKELADGGRLARFAYLAPSIEIVDVCEWGVPQKRQRCIAGNFDLALLREYRSHLSRRTLGDVVGSLAGARAVDPTYGLELSRVQLVDHDLEAYLSPEEERMNREMKTYHPVYNNMAFPDPLNRPGRTITATCTRVSRESVVIAAPEAKRRFRRLTVRERACLQTFPITYQFFGNSHSQKLKMVGNAVPPLFTFYVAQAMLGTKPERLPAPEKAIKRFRGTAENPPATRPDGAGETYPCDRRFRVAIPHLRFKSGVRFELSNSIESWGMAWRVRFFFGNSKSISELDLGSDLLDQVRKLPSTRGAWPAISRVLKGLENQLQTLDPSTMQSKWSHTDKDGTYPYDIVDRLGQSAKELIEVLGKHEGLAVKAVEVLLSTMGHPQGSEKVMRNAGAVLAGAFVGECANRWMRPPPKASRTSGHSTNRLVRQKSS